MKGAEQLFKSARFESNRATGSTDSWATPQKFFDLLHEEFAFTLDPCADASNAKCTYFDEHDDGLAQDWGANVCFVNFPYSHAKVWAVKCIDAAKNGATVVVLCASRTDTGWWHYLASHASDVRFVRGRLWFQRGDGVEMNAPFPSSVIVLTPATAREVAEGKVDGSQTIATLWNVPVEVRR